MTLPIDRHNEEIAQNLELWQRKPLLQLIYRGFHQEIAGTVRKDLSGIIVELGSGIGNIKEVLPKCLRTDLFPNPWLDQVENAYALSFGDSSVSHIILFDVFHHLEHPGAALKEFRRVLKPGGRVIIFDPCISLLGFLVYGLFHHEPIALLDPIQWNAPESWRATEQRYYAAQGNAYRVFIRQEFTAQLSEWNVLQTRRYSAISYVASGGYSKPQLYPDRALGMLRMIDRLCDFMPSLFATRILVVLEKS